MTTKKRPLLLAECVSAIDRHFISTWRGKTLLTQQPGIRWPHPHLGDEVGVHCGHAWGLIVASSTHRIQMHEQGVANTEEKREGGREGRKEGRKREGERGNS